SSAAALPGSERGAGFAIPVNETFLHAVQQLKLGKSVAYGFLGVAPDDAYHFPRAGVRIVNVVHGTPAAVSDLRTGDVITSVNDQPLNTAADLILHVAKYPAGQTVEVHLIRSGRPLVRDVTLSKKHVRAARPVIATADPPAWRGVAVDYPTAHARYVELSYDADPAGCVVVMDVAPDSPGWKAGLRSGMFISHVGERRVASPDAFQAAVSDAAATVRVSTVAQFGRRETIAVEP
ncbi:MAG: PDZ domain-containing protein, partial [Planctomycetales bacterium]|nr:PDZ domain-containing protein [Planctomycetales bacterium]